MLKSENFIMQLLAFLQEFDKLDFESQTPSIGRELYFDQKKDDYIILRWTLKMSKK